MAGDERNGSAVERQIVRELTRSLIDNPKAFAAEELNGAVSTLHQQLNGTRELPWWVIHRAQAKAGRWPVYEYQGLLAGLDEGVAVRGDPGLALLVGLAEVDVAMARYSGGLADAVAPESPGGEAVTLDELALLERALVAFISRCRRELAKIRGCRIAAAQPQGEQRRAG